MSYTRHTICLLQINIKILSNCFIMSFYKDFFFFLIIALKKKKHAVLSRSGWIETINFPV